MMDVLRTYHHTPAAIAEVTMAEPIKVLESIKLLVSPGVIESTGMTASALDVLAVDDPGSATTTALSTRNAEIIANPVISSATDAETNLRRLQAKTMRMMMTGKANLQEIRPRRK